MGWSIPTETVYEFLEENFHDFIGGGPYVAPEDRKPPKDDDKDDD